jgi:hypothetical protein
MGSRKSNKHVKIWAKNAFDEWRRFYGYKTNMSIADMLKKETSIKGLVDMLCLFVLQVAKKGTNMYPPTKYFFLILLFFFFSFLDFLYFNFFVYVFFFFNFFFIHGNIQALIKIIGRLIRQRQNQRIVETVVGPMVLFNIFTDVKYNHVKITDDKTTLQVLNASLGKSIKKFDVLSIKEENTILAQAICQPKSPYDLNLLFGYFCISNFFIRSYSELQNVQFEIFVLVQLHISLVLRFC